jgi:pyruvate dehydrogenase E2 component (dihydrolipoamide acetyltransferase)
MSFLIRNVELGRPLKLSSWRKIAIGSWRSASDPSVYSMLELDAEPALEYVEKCRTASGQRVTLTHFVGKVVAEMLKRHPQVNSVLRFGKLYPRKEVNIFLHVATDEKGEDLTGVAIKNADQLSVAEIAIDANKNIHAIRNGHDVSFKGSKSIMRLVPGFLARFFVDLTGFILYTLNTWNPLLGTARDPFGSAMVTNVGSLGIGMTFAPMAAYTRVSLVLAVGAVQEQPVVRNGQVQAGKVIKICVTFDHRIIDGVHASQMSRTFQKLFLNPTEEFGALA